MSCGIYKVTNNLNNKCYIGKAKNIEERWLYHKQSYRCAKEYDKLLYRAFRKYGLDNFNFEILELVNEDLLNDREKYWIEFYHSYEKGYNGTKGGDGGITVSDPRATYGKLTTEEVIYLRKRYIECKYPASLIYEKEFKNKISFRGFQAIWLGQNGKTIMPEVFSADNKQRQMKLNRAYAGVLRRRISLPEIQEARKRISQGESRRAIWKEKYQDIYTEGGFRDVLNNKHYDEEVNINELTPL